MVSEHKPFQWFPVLAVVAGLALAGFSTECAAQDDGGYRFLAGVPGFVYILKCEDGLCTRESTVIDAMDFRAWSVSADGEKLAGVWYQEDMDLVVKIVRLDGTPLAEHLLVDFPGTPSSSGWSPDERWLVLAGVPVTADDCFIDLEELSDGSPASCTSPGWIPDPLPIIRYPKWSPDGRYLLFKDEVPYYDVFEWAERNDIFVMNMEQLWEYGKVPALSITPSLLGNCGTNAWLSHDEAIYRCYGFPEPVDNPDPVPIVWYITNVETGETRRADVPVSLAGERCVTVMTGTHKVAFRRGNEPALAVWDVQTGALEEFSLAEDVEDISCIMWIPG